MDGPWSSFIAADDQCCRPSGTAGFGWFVYILYIYIYIQIYVCVSSLRGGYFGATGV